jgi:ABC-type molybdate transport system substrate-binding protein
LSKADTNQRGPARRVRPTPVAIRPWAALFAGLAILGEACTHEATKQAATSTAVGPESTGTITVLAAASLTDAFNEIGRAFETANPSVHVKFSYDVSAALATRANSGAPADVFASAGDTSMLKVTAAGNAPRPQTFARATIPEGQSIVAPYPIAVLRQSTRSDVARAFVDYVLSPPGQATLAKYGFLPPK